MRPSLVHDRAVLVEACLHPLGFIGMALLSVFRQFHADARHEGPENPYHWVQGLTRLYRFNGTAWYVREATVPDSWRGRRVALVLRPL